MICINKDDCITQVQYGDATHKVDYAYDGFGRLNTRKVYNGASTPVLTSQYTYNAGGFTQDGKTFSSNQVQKIEQEHITFTYTYDNVGNIVSELRTYKATGTTKVTTYAYDALGQLIRVNDQNDTTSGSTGTTWLYTYDRGGNILSKSRYAYAASGTTVGTRLEYVPYTYGDSNWKDKLTAWPSPRGGL